MSPDLKIYIEGYLMDVDDKVGKVATSYQLFSFLTIGSVKANNTNRISLPLTNNNIQRLEQIAPLSIITTKPYQNLSILVVQDGQATIPSGVCQIVGIQDRIKIDIQGGVKAFFDLLEGKFLNDIDLSSYNGLWDDARHDTVRNTTSGLVCPVTNNGQLVDSVTYVDGYTYGSAMIPFFYYATIIDKIFALTGYSKAGTIFADTNRYLKMAMSTRFVYNQKYIDDNTVIMARGNVSIPAVGYVYPPSLIDVDTEKFSCLASSTPTTPLLVKQVNSSGLAPFCKICVTVTAKIALTAGAINQITGVIFNGGFGGVSVSNITTSSNVDSDVLTVIADGYALAEQITNGITTIDSYIYVGLRNNDGISTANITNCVFRLDILNTTDTDKIQDNTWYYEFSKLLPRTTLKAFMADFMRFFGLLISEKNNVITFKTIHEVLTDTTPTTIELSRENKARKPDINYVLSGFAQENFFYWIIQDDEVIISSSYGRGSIEISNETLPKTLDLYTSIFTASDQVTDKRIRDAAQITIYDQAGPAFTKAASFGSRLVLLRDDDGVNFRFMAGTSRTDYFIGYFIDKNRTYSLDWQELIDAYYNTYETVLNRYADVQQEFLISLVEAAQMDLTKLKTKDGVTYLLEKVENHVPGQFAKFKLIRI